MKNKLIWLLGLSVVLTACDVDNTLDPIEEVVAPDVALSAGSADFSNYIAIGASFTAGITDGALFQASQVNSFPNIMSQKFAMVGGGDFGQPLMNDNIGGMVTSAGTVAQSPRLFFNGTGPAVLPATPTTVVGVPVSNAGSLNNYGVPGAKSFHLLAPGYGSVAGLLTSPPTANPYYVRMAPTQPNLITQAASKAPTFFTLSEIGGNDVLGYATSGGDGTNPITPATAFNGYFDLIIGALTTGPNANAKGLVSNVPYITSLPHFTTVPYNPVPLDAATAGALNQGYAGYNTGIQQAFGALVQLQVMTAEAAAEEVAKRTINFKAGEGNAMVMVDENLTDLGAINPLFAGIPQYRQTTSDDLFVLPLSSLIPSGYGTQIPLTDKWVLTPQEQLEIKTATDAYNAKIEAVVNSNPNLALVDLNAILQQASTTGIPSGDLVLTTDLVTGGLVSLDGIHLTARGYAVMANKMLEVIDGAFGSNFMEATNGLANAGNYPTNYPVTLR